MNHSERIKALHAYYQDKFIIGRTNTSELVKEFSELVDFEDFQYDIISFGAREALRDNFVRYYEENKLDLRDLRICAFKVIKNEKSARYYSELCSGMDFIYMMFDESTGFEQGNCAKLDYLWNIRRGILAEDYDERGDVYLSYLSILHLYYDNGDLQILG